ncbi:MAG TPA: hypothetical protein DHW02_02730, partial [Ktedonobacter sp.]|nr:hypothetical protein [Ktedonobacter sp.]
MLVTSDDGSEKDPLDISELAENVTSYEDRSGNDATTTPQHHFARVYAQQDEAIARNYYANNSPHPSWQLRLQRWFLVNTFTPPWLPRPIQHTYVGYIFALLLQIIVVLIMIALMHLFSAFTFLSLLTILAVAFTAISFGTAPSLFSTLSGLLLIDFFVLSPFMQGRNSIQYALENILFLVVGVIISISASQVERARRSAYAERTLLNAVIETVPDTVSIYDAQGRLVRSNSAGRSQDNKRVYEPLHRSYTTGKLQTPDGATVQQEQLPETRALQGETISAMEMVWHDSPQKAQYLSVSAAPLYDVQHGIKGAVTISHDITALRQWQAQTAVSSSELDAVFEAMTDGVFIFDKQGRVVRMNTAFRSLLGISTQPNYFERTREERRSLFRVATENGQPLPFEKWPQMRILQGETLKGETDVLLHTIDGRALYLSVSGAPVYAADGILTGGVAICRDITVRRHLEQYTQTALRGFLEMAQTLVQGIGSEDVSEQADELDIDMETITAVEQRMAELTSHVLQCQRVGIIAVESRTNRLLPIAVFGLPATQERLWWEHVPQMRPETMPDMLVLLNRLRTGEIISLDIAQVPGAYLYTLFSSRSILLAPMILRNEFMGFLILDNADEEYIYSSEEQALAGTVAKLAALIIERKQLLRERAEAQANELALREASVRMNEFLSIASHELKTPITTIKGSTQLLERRLRKVLSPDTLSPEERIHLQRESEDLLRRTNTQVSRLTRLIDDVLDVSRIQSNRLQPNVEPCDLMTIVQNSVRLEQQNVPSRVITLTMPEVASVPVLADDGRIEQVVTNYLSNALKYSSSEFPVAVSLDIVGNMARVAVRDEGIGLPEEEQLHVWERFYRVPDSKV